MTDKQIMIIAFIDAWYIIDAKNMDVLQGPFETHAEAKEAVKTHAKAKEAVKTRAWLMSRGWTP